MAEERSGTPGGWDKVRAKVTGAGLSEADKAIVAGSQRGGRAEEDEPETRPLGQLQKAVQDGKVLTAEHTYMSKPHKLEGLCVSINQTEDTVAVGCRDSKVILMDLSTLHVQQVHNLADGKVAAITALRYRPDGHGGMSNVAYMAQESQLLTVHVPRGQVMAKRQQDESINALAIRPTGNPMLATAGKDKVVHIYDETTGQLSMKLDHGDDYNTTGHSNIIHAVNWKPNDPNVLVSGGWDRTVNMWDIRLGRAVRSFSGPYICGGDNLDIRGDELLTGAWRHHNPLQLWDMGSGKLLTNCPFYQPETDACMLYTAKFAPGANPKRDLIVAGGSGKKPCVKFFETAGQAMGTLHLQTGVTAMASSTQCDQDGLRSVVLCGADRILLCKL